MFRHLHRVQAVMLVIVFAAIGASLLISKQLRKPADGLTADHSSYVSPEEPEFTTIITSARTQKSPLPQESTVAELNKHASDILNQIDFTQNEYVLMRTPSDPNFPLWHMTIIAAPTAWDTSTGSEQIVIAVVDSGFALAHEELADGWYENSGEIGFTSPGGTCWTGSIVDKRINNCDDDANGYIDDWRGWDFVSNDNSPQAGEENPNGNGISHGSLVSGLIGAAANNNVGFTGIDWSARIMPLQALSDNGTGYTADIVAAVEYAVDNGADIINMSLGGGYDDNALRAAVNYATSQNIPVVAAAGNCASLSYVFCNQLSAPGYMTYPALYPEVFAVGAVTATGSRPSFASYGPQLDFVAPGQGITMSSSWSSTNTVSAYAYGIGGTSFSTPIVSGVIGLLKANSPLLSVDDIRFIIRSTANGTEFNTQFGYGTVNAERALQAARTEAPFARKLNLTSISSSDGENPSAPVPSGSTIITTITSNPGEQITITARNLSTNANKQFQTIKIDQSGVYDFSWNTAFLGQGVWRITPNGLQTSGSSETIYISN